jgi:hypothetical protein
LSITPLPPKEQRLIAEIVMLRYFAVFEEAIASAAMRIACGVQYVDGSAPVLLHHSRTIAQAELNMRTLGRVRPLRYLKWTNSVDIKGNVKFVLDGAESFVTVIASYSAQIDEMRVVRNHIAHQNSDTRRKYNTVLSARYGGGVTNIAAGCFLLTNRWTPCILRQYFQTAEIILRAAIKG